MSGSVVNLRQFRKRRARQEKEKTAEANRIAYGRTKSEKNLTDTLNRKATRTLEQGRLEPKDHASDGSEDDPTGT